MIKINIQKMLEVKAGLLKKWKFLFILTLLPCALGIFFLGGHTAKADDFFFLKEISFPLEQDYVLTSSDGLFSINVLASSTNGKVFLKSSNLAKREEISQFFTYPDGLTPTSDLYSVRFEGNEDVSFSKQPKITLIYKENNKFNQLYYYNWYNLKFEKIEAQRDTIKHTLQFDMPTGQRSIIFAIFNEPELIGTASWYVHPRYRNDLIAASVDFTQDSKIKVINLENNKEVIVTVKDYGPDKSIFPDRVVDLSKEAFKLIASTSQGVVRVKVVPVE